MIAFEDGADVQPIEFVTVKVYVPGAIPEIVHVVRFPAVVVPPGLIVTVQLPEGKPLNGTLPVAEAQLGCTIVPTTGAEGEEGGEGITTSFDNVMDTHPDALVTEKLYVPGERPEIVVVTPDPVVVTPPGYLLRVHVPTGGKPFNTTLPVGAGQVGTVIAPTRGAAGVPGCARITAFPEEGETHPA